MFLSTVTASELIELELEYFNASLGDMPAGVDERNALWHGYLRARVDVLHHMTKSLLANKRGNYKASIARYNRRIAAISAYMVNVIREEHEGAPHYGKF